MARLEGDCSFCKKIAVVGNRGLSGPALFFVCFLYSPLKNAHFISQAYHVTRWHVWKETVNCVLSSPIHIRPLDHINIDEN